MVTPYGLTAAGAMLLLLLLTGFSCRRKGIPYRTFITFGALSLPLAFLLSRLTFALSNIPLYVNTLSNPLLMLHFWDGGASLLGALLGVLLASWLTGRIRRESVGRLMAITRCSSMRRSRWSCCSRSCCLPSVKSPPKATRWRCSCCSTAACRSCWNRSATIRTCC